MDIWLFGNPDLAEDAMPLRLKKQLEQQFPEQTFTIVDPLDEWQPSGELCIVDTVKGIDRVMRFDSIDQFQHQGRVTMHDFDLGMQLAFLKKLGKLPKLTIFGIPQTQREDLILKQLIPLLTSFLASKSGTRNSYTDHTRG